MAEELRVDPALLHMTSGEIVSAGCAYAADAMRHRDEFIAAVSRWRGASSREALQESAVCWEVRHPEHLRRMSGLAQHVGDSACNYTADAADSAEMMNALAGGGDAAGGAASDLAR